MLPALRGFGLFCTAAVRSRLCGRGVRAPSLGPNIATNNAKLNEQSIVQYEYIMEPHIASRWLIKQNKARGALDDAHIARAAPSSSIDVAAARFATPLFALVGKQ